MSDNPGPPPASDPRDLGIPPGPGPVERVVLLGYMTSGKSTVGQALARRLEWRFLDFDVEIERRAGTSVPDLVLERGQGALRDAEDELTAEAAGVARVVLAPGGGWITRPERLEMLGPGTLAVWLRVSPDETVRRLRADAIERPFREMDDPRPRIEAMLQAREPLYRLADLSIPTDGRSTESIAFEIETIVRIRGLSALDLPPLA
jgi:shikimate kinase